MSEPARPHSLLKYIYTHNPFYAISASLMLYAVLKAYGTLEVGTINTWIMAGVLAGYTLLLAVIGVLIVRRGKVWEDARSILLLLLALFVAVSICADDLFVRATSSAQGTALLLGGYLFSAIVSEAVLRGVGIRLGFAYRIPYHLMMALFYVVPWWCAPHFNMRKNAAIEWTLFLFPMAAAVLFLTLLPAVRRGAKYVANNGTPWPWPVFPWITFGVLAAAFSLRSFVLSMTFSRKGPIWQDIPGGRAIVFDTTWGPYFLVPLGLAILVLLLEMGLVARSQRFLQNVLVAAPALLLLSSPLGGGPVFRGFLTTFTYTVGSPVWLTVWGLLGFYSWGWLRGIAQARFGVMGALGLLSIVGARTIDISTFTQPQPLPFLIIGIILLANGLWLRSSREMAAAAIAVACGIWPLLPQSVPIEYRLAACYNLLMAAVVAIGLICRDGFARVLRFAGSLLILSAVIVVTTSTRAADVPLWWRASYVAALVVASLCIALLRNDRWYQRAFAGTLLVAAYSGISIMFRGAVGVIGRPAMTAFSWSFGALLLAVLISAHKARWLPRRMLPGWSNDHNGNGSQKSTPPVTSGMSSDTTP